VSEGRFDPKRNLEKPVPAIRRPERGPIRLADVQLFERDVFCDSRGSFTELWREERARSAGLPAFVQDNVARSRRGVVRGLHFQHPSGQAKLVSVAVGEVFDVAVDVRVGSSTFGCWTAVTLSESNGRQLYIPAGFAHGYQTLWDISVVVYKCSELYSPDDERLVRWNDEDIGIEWPIPNAILSDRDAAAPLLRDLPPEWLPDITL
jgi:dTDP-4-dehydrorhamnose 3,5-epimerase